jgi:hypothetical protein
MKLPHQNVGFAGHDYVPVAVSHLAALKSPEHQICPVAKRFHVHCTEHRSAPRQKASSRRSRGPPVSMPRRCYGQASRQAAGWEEDGMLESSDLVAFWFADPDGNTLSLTQFRS